MNCNLVVRKKTCCTTVYDIIMEKITFHYSSNKTKGVKVRYRLRNGRDVQICHSSDIVADAADLAKFNPDGTTKDRISVYNVELSKSLSSEYNIMLKAYALMRDKGYDMTTEVFEREISMIKNPVMRSRIENPNVVVKFRDYAEKSLRHGIIGDKRYKHICTVIGKLDRFLLIKGFSGLTVEEFSVEHLMDFRDFLFEEYLYVDRYPKLYEKVSKRNKPTERLSMNTVASQMKMFQTFFTLLEDKDEIQKSPFRKIGKEGKKVVMRTRYDDPVFLRKEELLKVISAKVPDNLQDTKDAFLVQCALGCRVGDFQRMGMQTIAVNEDGIPYVHYIPQKTADSQNGNEEVMTPIVRFAFDIIKRTNFEFPVLKNLYGSGGYNTRIKSLLQISKIDRQVPQYNEVLKQNEYCPLYKVGSSKLCRKTHVDMMNKVQVDMYAAGLHKEGSSAVKRYTMNELKDRFALMNAAFDQEDYRVSKKLNII